MPTNNTTLEENRELIYDLLKGFKFDLTKDFTQRLNKAKSITVSDYLDEALVPLIPKICAKRNQETVRFQALIALCFKGHLSQRAWDEIWKHLEEDEKISFTTIHYVAESPLTLAACHGNLVALRRLDKIYSQLLPKHRDRRYRMLLQLREALLETPKHLDTPQHVDSYNFLLDMCEKYATLIDENSNTLGFANKKFDYKISGVDSGEGKTPLLDVFADIGERYFSEKQIWALHQLAGYIRSKGTSDDFDQFKEKLKVLLGNKYQHESYRTCWEALESQPFTPAHTVSKEKIIRLYSTLGHSINYVDSLDNYGETLLHKLAIYANNVTIGSEESKFVINMMTFLLRGEPSRGKEHPPADPDILNMQNKTAFELLNPEWQDYFRPYFIGVGSLKVMQDVEKTKKCLDSLSSPELFLMSVCIIFSKSISNNVKNKIPNLKWVINYLLDAGVDPTNLSTTYGSSSLARNPFELILYTEPFNSDVAEIAKKLKEKTKWDDFGEKSASLQLREKESMLERELKDKPLYTMQDLFSRIKALSFNPKDEIYKRFFSITEFQNLCLNVALKDILPIAQYLIVPQNIIHVCGVTTVGLLAAIHGSQYGDSVEIKFDSLDKEIEPNAHLLQSSTDDTNFFTYAMGFGVEVIKNDGEKLSDVHSFVIIQYKDFNNAIRYRFFQSSVGEYSLNEFLKIAEENHQSNDLSQGEFNEFLKQAAAFAKAKHWTKDMDNFYQRYFNKTLDFNGREISEIEFQVEKRMHSLDKSLQEWNDVHTQKSKYAKPKIICPAETDRDVALLDKLRKAPPLEAKNSTILMLIHDPKTGNHAYKSVSKKYLKTFQALEHSGRKDEVIYYSQYYDSSLAGKAAVYSTLFAETRALISGKRQLFANTRAFIAGTGSLFANTRALLSGNRPLFANVRRSFGKISDQDIQNSSLGIKKGSKS